MKNEAEKQANPDIKEVKIGLSLVDSILNRAIFNHCSIVLFDKENPEKFDLEVKDLASRHSDTATIYKDLEGNTLLASDLYFNPYNVKTIASIHKEYKGKAVDLLEGMGFEMRGKQYHITDVSYDRDDEEIKVEYENLSDGTEHTQHFSSFYYWMINNETETMSQFDFKELKNLWDEISAKEEEKENLESQPEYGTNKGILKVLGEHQDEIKSVHTNYSGRGMYGKECFGIVVESYSAIEDELDKYNVMGSKDSMGRDTIIYWPGTTYEKLKSEDSEGVLDGFDISESTVSVDTINELKKIARSGDYDTLPVCIHDAYNGEVYYVHKIEGLKLTELASDAVGCDLLGLLQALPNEGEVKVVLDGKEYPVLAVDDTINGRIDLNIESDPDLSEDYDDEGNLLNTSESANEYALKPMLEELESKGYKTIDEGSDQEITVYVFNSDAEFTDDVFLALIFGSSDNGNYELVDIVNSNFKNTYPDKYKEIEEIAGRHEKKDEAEAVRMESLASISYDFRAMKANINGKIHPMRIDNEASMVDIWYDDQGEWIWSEEATDAFFSRRGKMPTESSATFKLIVTIPIACDDEDFDCDEFVAEEELKAILARDTMVGNKVSQVELKFLKNLGQLDEANEHFQFEVSGPNAIADEVANAFEDFIDNESRAGLGDHYVVFFEEKLDGSVSEALGSDAVLPLDNRLGILKMIELGHDRARKLAGIKKFVGFKIIKGYLGSGSQQELTDLIPLKYSEALHPEQKGGQEIKLRKIADKYIDEVAKHAHTGIVQHAILDPEASDLNKEQILSVRKALVEVGNRNMGHDRVRKEGKEGVIAGSDIAEFASWITSDCMALTADYLMDNIEDRNAQETYTFAKSKLEDCLMDFYRTETNRSNYPETYAFWEDLIYGQKAFGTAEAEESVDFFTVYLMKEKTEEGVQFLCDLVSEAFDTSCSIVDNSAFNVYKKGKLKGNEKAEMQVSNLIGQSEILEIA